MDADQSTALEVHQQARAELSIAPLQWDQNLANAAQQYANQLASADQGMVHCPQLPQLQQGENIGHCSGPWANPQTGSSQLWYAEKKDWHGGVVQMQGIAAIGHYTQMIWSTTTNVGMAVACSPSGATYVVARYTLPGNHIGVAPDAVKVGAPQSPAQNQLQVQRRPKSKTQQGASQMPPGNKYDQFEQYWRGPGPSMSQQGASQGSTGNKYNQFEQHWQNPWNMGGPPPGYMGMPPPFAGPPPIPQCMGPPPNSMPPFGAPPGFGPGMPWPQGHGGLPPPPRRRRR